MRIAETLKRERGRDIVSTAVGGSGTGKRD